MHATLAVHALNTAHRWLRMGPHQYAGASPTMAVLEPLEEAYRKGRLEIDAVLAASSVLREQSPAAEEARQGMSLALSLLWGLGLLAHPDKGPAFEPIRDCW